MSFQSNQFFVFIFDSTDDYAFSDASLPEQILSWVFRRNRLKFLH